MSTITTADPGSLRSGPDPSFILAIAMIVALWLLTILALGAQGAFHAQPGTPPYATLLAFIGPPILFLASLRNRFVARQILQIDPVWIVAVQGLRILGAGFLFVYSFGPPAGNIRSDSRMGRRTGGDLGAFRRRAACRRSIVSENAPIPWVPHSRAARFCRGPRLGADRARDDSPSRDRRIDVGTGAVSPSPDPLLCGSHVDLPAHRRDQPASCMPAGQMIEPGRFAGFRLAFGN